MIYFSSDHHYGHHKIIEYCDRPFESVKEMNAAMIDAWNETVGEDDLVYYIGDFSMRPYLVGEFLQELNGTKILIAGNHDKCFKKESWIQTYLDAGFAEIHKQLTIEIAGEEVLLNHFPYFSYVGQSWEKSRPIDEGKWLIHGHIHNKGGPVRGKMINVSVEQWSYKPVSITQIEEIINELPRV